MDDNRSWGFEAKLHDVVDAPITVLTASGHTVHVDLDSAISTVTTEDDALVNLSG